jgi:hypothetical protein
MKHCWHVSLRPTDSDRKKKQVGNLGFGQLVGLCSFYLLSYESGLHQLPCTNHLPVNQSVVEAICGMYNLYSGFFPSFVFKHLLFWRITRGRFALNFVIYTPL